MSVEPTQSEEPTFQPERPLSQYNLSTVRLEGPTHIYALPHTLSRELEQSLVRLEGPEIRPAGSTFRPPHPILSWPDYRTPRPHPRSVGVNKCPGDRDPRRSADAVVVIVRPSRRRRRPPGGLSRESGSSCFH